MSYDLLMIFLRFSLNFHVFFCIFGKKHKGDRPPYVSGRRGEVIVHLKNTRSILAIVKKSLTVIGQAIILNPN